MKDKVKVLGTDAKPEYHPDYLDWKKSEDKKKAEKKWEEFFKEKEKKS